MSSDLRLTEWLFATMWLNWGLWLLAPWWDTFANPQYAALAHLMPEWCWGFASILFALARMATLIVNGRWRRTPLARCIFSIAGMWWLVTLVYLYRNIDLSHAPAGFSWYPAFILFEGINVWRSAADGVHRAAFSFHLPRVLVNGRG